MCWEQKARARIVVVTCRSALEGVGLKLADMNYKSRRYDAGGAYHSSKLALVYFAMELALRCGNGLSPPECWARCGILKYHGHE